MTVTMHILVSLHPEDGGNMFLQNMVSTCHTTWCQHPEVHNKAQHYYSLVTLGCMQMQYYNKLKIIITDFNVTENDMIHMFPAFKGFNLTTPSAGINKAVVL
jgi:hypothetical protein